MRVPVDDGVAAREQRREPRLPPHRRPRRVGHPDPDALEFDDALRREQRLQRRLVGVAGHRRERRPERPQLLEEPERGEVARMQHEVGRTQPLHARRREHAPPAGQVRVRDDRDARYRTVYGALTRTVGPLRVRRGRDADGRDVASAACRTRHAQARHPVRLDRALRLRRRRDALQRPRDRGARRHREDRRAVGDVLLRRQRYRADEAPAAEARLHAQHARLVAPAHREPGAAVVGHRRDRGLHERDGVLRRPVCAEEAALEAVAVVLVDEVEEVERGHGRVAGGHADRLRVVAALRQLVDRADVLGARVRARRATRSASRARRGRRRGPARTSAARCR